MLALIAQPNSYLQEIYRKVFSYCGYDVKVTTDSQETIDVLTMRNPSILVLDMSSPEVANENIMFHLEHNGSSKSMCTILVGMDKNVLDHELSQYADVTLSPRVAIHELIFEIKRLRLAQPMM